MKPAYQPFRWNLRAVAMWSAAVLLPALTAAAGETQWIWSAEQTRDSVPEGACYFRKSFTLEGPTAGDLKIAADDEYEAYLNGRRIGTGESTERLDQYDVTNYLRSGMNLLAVRVTNKQGSTAALGVRLTVKERSRGEVTILSDESWLTNLRALPLWQTPLYNDSRWSGAQALGPVGRTPPWDDVSRQEEIAGVPTPADRPAAAPAGRTLAASDRKQTSVSRVSGNRVMAKSPAVPTPVDRAAAGPADRMPAATDGELTPAAREAGNRATATSRLAPVVSPPHAASPAPADNTPTAETAPKGEDQFVVEQVLDGQTTGSLLALTFNEFGHALAARDPGGLLLIHDSNHDGLIDQVRIANDQIKDCRGLLCLNGDVFATGNGPEGLALYRLTDQDRDGRFEQLRALLKFEGNGGRYGPHGVVLGTDGFLYVAVGCQARPVGEIGRDSPYRDYYEGDLVQPRYEDPDAEMLQVKAPAGMILRLTPDGKQLQAVAGGLHDAADLAFDEMGELFTQDSEAAADAGLPWFRQASVYHVLPGAEYGWRSGSAKWPEHFVDRLPPTLETGRGVVTGLVFYNHYAFPEEYQNALFFANWTQGRISALRLKPNGGSYTAASDLFVDDPTLHVTDMAVGPDGALYFVTGDRGMAGGLYRIRWTGQLPPGAMDVGKGLSAVVRQPQLADAWSRQSIAAAKVELGADWGPSIVGVAHSGANPWRYRTRALDLLRLYGPTPTTEQLSPLAGAENEQVRAKAAELMGIHPDEETREALIGLLSDSDRAVCRRACEALVRAGQTPPPDKLLELLKSDDRFTAWSARRLLERIPADQWRDRLLASDHQRLVIQAGLALLVSQPSPENARRVLERLTGLAAGFTSDRDFIDMLRLMQVALIRGQIAPDQAVELAQLLTEEFPSSDRLMNRELTRLLTYLRVSTILDRYLEYLSAADVQETEKLHMALHLPLLKEHWNVGRRIQLIEFLDAAQTSHGGSSRTGYITRAGRDFAKDLSDEELKTILSEGDRWPHAAVALLYRLPQQLDADTLATLKQLDERLQARHDAPTSRLKVGLVAVMARSGDAESLAYLRSLWDRDPERRPALAMGLAQSPAAPNWNYLVRSLPIVEADVAQEILQKLKTVQLAPEEPEYYRQVILRGLALGDPGAEDAIALLQHWTGIQQVTDGDWKTRLAAWQRWFAQTWPDSPPAAPPAPPEGRVWKYEELLRQVAGDQESQGSVQDGAALFRSATCGHCHRCGDQGEGRAPDLTTVRQRLMRKEIVKALLHPSEMIAVPYLNKTVVTTKGRVISGRISPIAEPGKVVIVRPDGRRMAVPDADVEESRAVPASDMPEGLLEPLTSQQVRDLFAFLLADRQPLLAQQPSKSAEPGKK